MIAPVRGWASIAAHSSPDHCRRSSESRSSIRDRSDRRVAAMAFVSFLSSASSSPWLSLTGAGTDASGFPPRLNVSRTLPSSIRIRREVVADSTAERAVGREPVVVGVGFGLVGRFAQCLDLNERRLHPVSLLRVRDSEGPAGLRRGIADRAVESLDGRVGGVGRLRVPASSGSDALALAATANRTRTSRSSSSRIQTRPRRRRSVSSCTYCGDCTKKSSTDRATSRPVGASPSNRSRSVHHLPDGTRRSIPAQCARRAPTPGRDDPRRGPTGRPGRSHRGRAGPTVADDRCARRAPRRAPCADNAAHRRRSTVALESLIEPLEPGPQVRPVGGIQMTRDTDRHLQGSRPTAAARLRHRIQHEYQFLASPAEIAARQVLTNE